MGPNLENTVDEKQFEACGTAHSGKRTLLCLPILAIFSTVHLLNGLLPFHNTILLLLPSSK